MRSALIGLTSSFRKFRDQKTCWQATKGITRETESRSQRQLCVYLKKQKLKQPLWWHFLFGIVQYIPLKEFYLFKLVHDHRYVEKRAQNDSLRPPWSWCVWHPPPWSSQWTGVWMECLRVIRHLSLRQSRWGVGQLFNRINVLTHWNLHWYYFWIAKELIPFNLIPLISWFEKITWSVSTAHACVHFKTVTISSEIKRFPQCFKGFFFPSCLNPTHEKRNIPYFSDTWLGIYPDSNYLVSFT